MSGVGKEGNLPFACWDSTSLTQPAQRAIALFPLQSRSPYYSPQGDCPSHLYPNRSRSLCKADRTIRLIITVRIVRSHQDLCVERKDGLEERTLRKGRSHYWFNRDRGKTDDLIGLKSVTLEDIDPGF